MKKLTLAGIKNMSETELKGLKAIDEVATTEYILCIENMREIYFLLVAYKKTLDKKISKDQFNYTLAVKGIQNIIDRGFKQYIKDFSSPGATIKDIVNINDRIYIYNYFLEKFLLKNFE